MYAMCWEKISCVPVPGMREEELGNLTRKTARKGSGRTIRPLMLKALLHA